MAGVSVRISVTTEAKGHTTTGVTLKVWNPGLKLQPAVTQAVATSSQPTLCTPRAQHAHVAADPPAPDCPVIRMFDLDARISCMFLSDGECPQRSGFTATWSASSLKLIVAAATAVNNFWSGPSGAAAEVKAACAPRMIDKQEVAGYMYLVADLLGHALLHPDELMPCP